jgi:hypothetical protein
MVDWRTLFHLQELGCELGWRLRERGVALAAWTIKDEPPEIVQPLARRLLGLGAETLIAEAPVRLGQYLSGVEPVQLHQPVTQPAHDLSR